MESEHSEDCKAPVIDHQYSPTPQNAHLETKYVELDTVVLARMLVCLLVKYSDALTVVYLMVRVNQP
jgi:hypothetical protein